MAWLDGNWVDISSLTVAIIYAFLKMKRKKKKFISKATAVEIANGCSIFPLVLLGLSIVSSSILNELLHANKLILSVAGVCALLAMLEDDF